MVVFNDSKDPLYRPWMTENMEVIPRPGEEFRIGPWFGVCVARYTGHVLMEVRSAPDNWRDWPLE